MRFLSRTLFATVTFALISACRTSDTTGPVRFIAADGIVRYVSLEGGFYSLESGSGKYDPMNLPSSFQQDGLRVHFVGVVRNDMGSIHMYGPILELSEIQRR